MQYSGYLPGEGPDFSMIKLLVSTQFRTEDRQVIRLLCGRIRYDRDSGKHLLPKEEMKMNNVLPSDLPLNSYI